MKGGRDGLVSCSHMLSEVGGLCWVKGRELSGSLLRETPSQMPPVSIMFEVHAKVWQRRDHWIWVVVVSTGVY